MFIRKKKRGGNEFLYLVRSYRDQKGRPRQQIVRYLGSMDPSRRSTGAITMEDARKILAEEQRRRKGH